MMMVSGHSVLTHHTDFTSLQARPEMSPCDAESHMQLSFPNNSLVRPGTVSELPHSVPSPSWLGQKGGGKLPPCTPLHPAVAALVRPGSTELEQWPQDLHCSQSGSKTSAAGGSIAEHTTLAALVRPGSFNEFQVRPDSRQDFQARPEKLQQP
eukprot:2437034-Amphidinium_carterae.1